MSLQNGPTRRECPRRIARKMEGVSPPEMARKMEGVSPPEMAGGVSPPEIRRMGGWGLGNGKGGRQAGLRRDFEPRR